MVQTTIPLPVGAVLIKLYAGMVVFLVIGYLMLYLLDRPVKKELDISSVVLFSRRWRQWLYDFTKDAAVLGNKGVKRVRKNRRIDAEGEEGLQGQFVKPDIHYGPFADIGGSVTTQYMGSKLLDRYNATPFVLHGAVDVGTTR